MELRRPSLVAVATDGSPTAGRAVDFAAEMAARYDAELLLVRALARDGDGQAARELLERQATEAAGGRGRALVVSGEDPAGAIVHCAEEQGADVLVVGNVAMRGRKEFLLGNVPNRVSHLAHCTVVIVNTAGDAPPAPAAAAAPEAPEEGALLGRAAKIARVMAKHGLGGRLRGGAEEDATRAQARRLRDALDELGPTFAKLGQILSTRPDLLPPEVVAELATLQDHVRPLAEAEIVAAMERELGVPWEDVFESIEPEPLAAGTIAQVHRATLASGERVVVKVQRPTAERDILDDLGLLELFGRRAEGREALRRVVDIPAIVEHLSSSLRRELDFRQEAANIERMRQVLEPYPRLAVPAVHAGYSTARLLVLEEVQGAPIREAPQGDARREAARQLLESYYRQILVDGFFHADPHPGNLMWWQDRIYFLDFGMVGELEPAVRELLLLVLMAFARDDAAFLADVTMLLAGGGQTARSAADPEAFGRDLAALMERHRRSSLREMELGPVMQDMTEVAIRHGVPLPASVALTGKAMAQMQLATGELDPGLDAFRVAGEFVARTMLAELRGQADPQRLLYEGRKLRLRAVRLAEAIERATGARPGESLRVEWGGAERVEEAIERAGRRIALGMVGAAVLLAGALISGSRDRAASSAPRRVLPPVGRWPAPPGGRGGRRRGR